MSDHSEEHIQIIRAMTFQQKFDALANLYWMARDLKAAGLRLEHPDWTEEQVQKKVREIFMYARG